MKLKPWVENALAGTGLVMFAYAVVYILSVLIG